MRKEDPFHHQGSTNQNCHKHHVTKSISGVFTVSSNACVASPLHGSDKIGEKRLRNAVPGEKRLRNAVPDAN